MRTEKASAFGKTNETALGGSKIALGGSKIIALEGSKKTREIALEGSKKTREIALGGSKIALGGSKIALGGSKKTRETALEDCRRTFVGCARGL